MAEVFQLWENSVWLNAVKTEFHYDVTGLNLMRYEGFTWDTTTGDWHQNYEILNSYNSAGYQETEICNFWDQFSEQYLPYYKRSLNYDVSGNLTTIMDEFWIDSLQAYRNSTKRVYAYNSFNQPVVATTYYWVDSAWTLIPNADRWNWYYESYSPTAISVLEDPKALLAIFPNPAGRNVSITLSWNEPQSISGTITDIQGRMYQSFTAPAAKDWKTTFSTESLPSGNYFINIRGSKGGAATQQFSVVR